MAKKSHIVRTSPTTLQWGDDLRVDDYRRKQTKKAEPNDPAFPLYQSGWFYFLNFLLSPTSPSRPEPRRSMVAGSGTGA